MSFSFEADSDLCSIVDWQDGEYVGDFEEFFEDEDFESLGIDPIRPTEAKPGSEDKVMMLAARYAAGLPLWHKKDCYDHAPAMIEEEELE